MQYMQRDQLKVCIISGQHSAGNAVPDVLTLNHKCYSAIALGTKSVPTVPASCKRSHTACRCIVLRALCDMRCEKDDARAVVELSLKTEKQQRQVLGQGGTTVSEADMMEAVRPTADCAAAVRHSTSCHMPSVAAHAQHTCSQALDAPRSTAPVRVVVRAVVH